MSWMNVFSCACVDPLQSLFSVLWNIKLTPWSQSMDGIWKGVFKAIWCGWRRLFSKETKALSFLFVCCCFFDTLPPESKCKVLEPCLHFFMWQNLSVCQTLVYQDIVRKLVFRKGGSLPVSYHRSVFWVYTKEYFLTGRNYFLSSQATTATGRLEVPSKK